MELNDYPSLKALCTGMLPASFRAAPRLRCEVAELVERFCAMKKELAGLREYCDGLEILLQERMSSGKLEEKGLKDGDGI